MWEKDKGTLRNIFYKEMNPTQEKSFGSITRKELYLLMIRRKLISTSDLVRAHLFMHMELSGHVLSPVKLEFLRANCQDYKRTQ